MEDLQPNPHYRPKKKRKPVKRKKATVVRQGPSTSTLRANTQQQPRDNEGKFAEKGGWFKGAWLDPTPKAPTKLKKRPAPLAQRSFSETRRIGPFRKKRRKKPVPQRSFLGKIGAVLNGDYAKWKQRQNQKNAHIALPAQGIKPSRRWRRRKPAHPTRRQGLFNRLFS